MKEKVEVGDWSKDGHNMSDTFIIEVPDDIDTNGAYRIACDVLGFSMEEYCNAFEDTKFPAEHFEKIIECTKKYNVPLVFDQYSDLSLCVENRDMTKVSDEAGAYVHLTPDDFFALWLAMLNIGIAIATGGERVFAFEIKTTQENTHYIGGYGLYYG